MKQISKRQLKSVSGAGLLDSILETVGEAGGGVLIALFPPRTTPAINTPVCPPGLTPTNIVYNVPSQTETVTASITLSGPTIGYSATAPTTVGVSYQCTPAPVMVPVLSCTPSNPTGAPVPAPAPTISSSGGPIGGGSPLDDEAPKDKT